MLGKKRKRQPNNYPPHVLEVRTEQPSQWGAGKVDGVIDLRDIAVALSAMVAIVISSGVSMWGLQLLLIAAGISKGPFSIRGFVVGMALGMVVGGSVAVSRLFVDLLNKNKRPEVPTVTAHVGGDQVDVPAPVIPSYGIRVAVEDNSGDSGQVRYATLLEEMETTQAVRTMRRVASSLLREGGSLSKRGAGRFLGENLNQVKSEMSRLGLLVKSGTKANSPYVLTPAGVQLMKELTGRQITGDDPVVIRIE